MISKLKAFFDKHLNKEENEESQNKAELAAATLMIEVAFADNNYDSDEKVQLTDALQKQFGLDQQVLKDLVELAEEERNEANSLYEFTRLINDSYNSDEKFELIKSLWHVAYADSELDKYEESTIRKISDLLYIPHSQMMNAKHLAKK